MIRRFVFVPIFGFSNMEGSFLKHPYISAWGFLDDEKFVPVHTDPLLPDVLVLNEAHTLSDAEIAEAVEMADGSTDLPDEVCIALAKFTLLPVSPE